MPTLKIKTWLDSGANCHSAYKVEFEINESEWNAMSEEERDDYARGYAWECMDWGWVIVD